MGICTRAEQRAEAAAGSSADPSAVFLLGPKAAAVARASFFAVAVILGAPSVSREWVLLTVCVVVGCWVAGSALAVARGRQEALRRTVLLVDSALVLAGLGSTGGAESGIALLLGAAPLAVAFQFRAPAVVPVWAATAAVVIATSADRGGAVFWSVLAVLGWAAASGAAFASDRRRGMLELRHEVRLREQLVAARSTAPARERSRVALELQAGALQGLRSLRQDLGARRAPAELADSCASVAAKVRAVVYELHALSARPINLSTAVSHVAARRAEATGRTIDVSVAPDAQGLSDEFALVLSRDLLDAVVQLSHGAGLRVAVTVAGGKDGLLRIDITPTPSDAGGSLFRSAITEHSPAFAPARERLSTLSGTTLRVDEYGVHAAFQGDSTSAKPVRPVEYSRLTLCLPRVLALITIAATAAVSGEHHTAFWVVVGVTACVAIPTTTLLLRGVLDRPDIVQLAVLDVVLVLVLFGLASHVTREHLLPLIVGFVPIFACALPAPWVIALAGGLGAGTVALGGRSIDFLAAYGWATVLALLLSRAVIRGERKMRASLDNSRSALAELISAEDAMRKAVAGKLHDDALQLLFAARQDLEEAADPSQTHDALNKAAAALDAAESVLMRTGDTDAHHSAPADGLTAALTALAETVAAPGGLLIHTALSIRDDQPATAALILKVARELLTNVARHASATNAYLTVDVDPQGQTTLSVTDDGTGLSRERMPAAAAEGHVGLAWVVSGVQEAGGQTHIRFQEDPPITHTRSGTAITVTLPAEYHSGTRAATRHEGWI